MNIAQTLASKGPMRRYYYAVGIIVALCIAAVVTNQTIGAGGGADEKRADDLNNISAAVNGYVQIHSQLPASLSQVRLVQVPQSGPVSSRPVYIAPDSGQLYFSPNSYTYIRESATRYQLCATFQTDTTHGLNNPPDVADTQMHKKGQVCFNYSATLPTPTPPPAPPCTIQNSCPDAITNLRITYINPNGVSMTAYSQTSKLQVLGWSAFNLPLVKDASGKITTLSALKVGQHVDIVSNGQATFPVAEIHIRP